MARERQVDALAMGAAGVLVAHRADDGKAMGLLREHRQERADLRAGNAGRNRREFATHLGRSVGLQIERVHLRRAAAHEEQDARLGTACPDGRR